MNARHFRDLRAWQEAYTFKLRIYELIDSGSLSRGTSLEKQLRDAARSAPSQISEGFGRFDPVDFGRFVKMARASLQECKNHLLDAVDRSCITEDVRQEYEQLIGVALKEIGGLLDYLHSPEAKRNAERIRQKREERRQRRNQQRQNQERRNLEPGTQNGEP